MKVTFEELKGLLPRLAVAEYCGRYRRRLRGNVRSHHRVRCLFPRREPLSRFIQQLDNGDIIPDAKPQRVTSLGAIEQWDAQRAIGNLTAKR